MTIKPNKYTHSQQNDDYGGLRPIHFSCMAINVSMCLWEFDRFILHCEWSDRKSDRMTITISWIHDDFRCLFCCSLIEMLSLMLVLVLYVDFWRLIFLSSIRQMCGRARDFMSKCIAPKPVSPSFTRGHFPKTWNEQQQNTIGILFPSKQFSLRKRYDSYWLGRCR